MPTTTDADLDYREAFKLHSQRPADGTGPYTRTVIGDVTVVTNFDSGIVGIAINDDEAPTAGEPGGTLGGIVMTIDAADAAALAHALATAAGIAAAAHTPGESF